jgi:hypothetical protein
MAEPKKKQFFFEKKNQKTFVNRRRCRAHAPRLTEVFARFFQKALLPSL